MTATSRQKLLTQKKSLVDQIKALNQKSAQAQINLMRAEADLKRVEKELVKAKPEFEITEHAILRYLERITGIDLEMIKAAFQLSLEFANHPNHYPHQYTVVQAIETAQAIYKFLKNPEQ